MDELILAFLEAYAYYLDWPERGWEALSRKLCEQYKYSPKNGREFLLIAFGWLWGRNNEEYPFIKANCLCGLLKLKLDEVYAVVAKENDWPDD